MLSPPREPGRRYPVFVQVYGGPGAGRQATRAWASPIQQYLAQHGWIVFSLDNRGSPDRGKAFENHIYRAMGNVEVQDQLAGVAWLRGQDYVDPRPCRGLRLVLWRLHGAEAARGGAGHLRRRRRRRAGHPLGAVRHPLYRALSRQSQHRSRALSASGAIPNAGRIADPLLLVHGMADDNVVFENSTVLMAALQAAGRPFDMMVYPGATHGVSGEARQLHLWRTITRFLDRTARAAPLGALQRRPSSGGDRCDAHATESCFG